MNFKGQLNNFERKLAKGIVYFTPTADGLISRVGHFI